MALKSIKIGLISIVLFLVGCASKAYNPILIQRGVEPFEREFHVTQEGYGVPKNIKKTFMSGYIEEGMTQEMVRLLWGPPNRSFEDNKVWEYTDREGNIITTVKFFETEVVLGMERPLVTEISGDRYGGSAAPGSK
jgi:hypothetical protein